MPLRAVVGEYACVSSAVRCKPRFRRGETARLHRDERQRMARSGRGAAKDSRLRRGRLLFPPFATASRVGNRFSRHSATVGGRARRVGATGYPSSGHWPTTRAASAPRGATAPLSLDSRRSPASLPAERRAFPSAGVSADETLRGNGQLPTAFSPSGRSTAGSGAPTPTLSPEYHPRTVLRTRPAVGDCSASSHFRLPTQSAESNSPRPVVQPKFCFYYRCGRVTNRVAGDVQVRWRPMSHDDE